MYRDYYEKLYSCLESTEYLCGKDPMESEKAFEKIIELFLSVKNSGHQLFFIGNGGSAAIAGHMTADFMKNGRMRTVSLYAPAMLTCMGNDYGYEAVFAKPLEMLGQEGDLLVTVSSSGNSANIIQAIRTARERCMYVITFSGFRPDNQSRAMGDYNVYVPAAHYGLVESIHNLLLQQVVDVLMELEQTGGTG